MNKSILITGANGFIGRNLSYKLKSEGYQVLEIDSKKESTAKNNIEICNVTNFNNLNKHLNTFRPEIIIHCAAIKNLPECEENKDKSFKTNVLSTEYLVNYANKSKSQLIYISSDVVFDGKKGNYSEDDTVNPINWYGKTKVFSETIVKSLTNYAICRTALVIGKLPASYKKILESELTNDILINQTILPQYVYERLKRGKKVSLPSIIISNPTPVELLCKCISLVINKKLKGTFHTAGPDSISRFDLGNLICNLFGYSTNQVNESNQNISDLRPRNISLNTINTFNKLGINPEEWRLKNYLSQNSLYV